MEILESRVSCHMAVHLPLSPLSIVESSVSGFKQGCRRIGKFGGGMGLIAYRFQQMEVGTGEAYLQKTLLLGGGG